MVEKTQVPLEEALCLQPCSSSLMATHSLDQAWMFEYCHEGSSQITAGWQKYQTKNNNNKSTEGNSGPRGHKSIVVPDKTDKADKTAPAQLNAFGKIYFHNKTLRYLYPEQGTGRGRKEERRGGSRARTAGTQSQRGPGRQRRAKADGIHINPDHFSLCICR